jgi:hypothetical protein
MAGDKLLCVHRFSDGGLCNYPRDHRRHTRWPEWEPTFVRHPFVEPRSEWWKRRAR